MKEKHKLKDLLKMVGPESPSSQFTDLVMDQLSVNIDLEETTFRETLLAQKGDLITSPPMAFERELFEKLKARQKWNKEPVLIPQWLVIGVIVLFLAGAIISSIFFPDPNEPSLINMNIDLAKEINALSNSSIAFQKLMLCLIIAAGLLTLDRFLRPDWNNSTIKE